MCVNTMEHEAKLCDVSEEKEPELNDVCAHVYVSCSDEMKILSSRKHIHHFYKFVTGTDFPQEQISVGSWLCGRVNICK